MTVIPRRPHRRELERPLVGPDTGQAVQARRDAGNPPTGVKHADKFSRVHHLVVADPRLDPYDVTVYTYGLSRDWGREKSKFVDSYTGIAISTGMGETKVALCLKILLETDLFTLIKRGGRGLANEYRVTQPHSVAKLYSGELLELIEQARSVDREDKHAVKMLKQRQRETRQATMLAAERAWAERHVTHLRTPDGRKPSIGGFAKQKSIREQEERIRGLGEANKRLVWKLRRLEEKTQQQAVLGTGPRKPADAGHETPRPEATVRPRRRRDG